MPNIKNAFSSQPIRLFLAALSFVTLVGGTFAPSVALAQTSCGTTTAPPTTYGQVKQSISVATSGTYRVWSRIKAPNTTANSYYFQIDSGCATVVGDATSIPANSWTWVNYKAGSTSSFFDVTLTAGTHQLTYTGKEADVQLDRVLLLGDLNCVPSALGDNCANVDAILPTVSLTAPANNTSVAAGTAVTISATANDNVGVTKVEFYVDGAVKNTDTTAPYSYSWSTTGVASGSHSISARAYDAANNTATSSPLVNITITGGSTTPPPPPPPTGGDTTAPTVSMSVSPTSVAVGGSVTASATASDNVGVTKVEFYLDGKLWGTDTSAPYSYTWTTSSASVKSLYAKAYDSAGNVGQSSPPVSLTVGGSTTPPPPTTPPPTTPPPPPPTGNPVPGDANGDGRVNAIDYGILVDHDGQAYAPSDFNKDGIVGAADLAILLSHWTW